MSHYWAPLLSVCTGTRRDAIFYLTPNDILQKDGIWILQIQATGSKKGTSESVNRDIPIHPLLKRLRFLEFVQQRRRTYPDERLFSEYKAGQEHAGMVFSRSFVHWIKTTVHALPEEQKSLFGADFHFPSLRALFSIEAIRSRMSEVSLRTILGSGGLERSTVAAEEQYGLACADVEIQRMAIESYFPPLFTYEDLMA